MSRRGKSIGSLALMLAATQIPQEAAAKELVIYVDDLSDENAVAKKSRGKGRKNKPWEHNPFIN